MRKLFPIVTAILILPQLLAAQQKAYSIRVKVEGYEGRQAYLAYYYGDKTYVKDTVAKGADGWFEFSGNEKLPPGMYMAVLPPDNQYVEMLVDKENQHIRMETKHPKLVDNMVVDDIIDNEVFYDYLKYLNKQRAKQQRFEQGMKAQGINAQQKKALQDSLNQLDMLVKVKQYEIFAFFPEYLSSAIIKAGEIPEPKIKFSGTEAEQKDKRFYWIRDHWFDNLNMGDARMLRTKVQFEHVNHYVNNMTVQQPDSVIVAVDKVLELARPAPETFKFYLIYFLNTYAKSRVMGMDAVYVHLARKYYATGQAPWTNKDDLQKIVDNARLIEPLLIGKQAPDIVLPTPDGKKERLKEVGAKYTILYFWSPDNSKEEIQKLVDFARINQGQGIKVYAVCTAADGADCRSFIEQNDMGLFVNVLESGQQGRYSKLYDVRTTPKIFVLDAKKIILSKNIGAGQLKQVFESLQ